jgi:hypothetical protein
MSFPGVAGGLGAGSVLSAICIGIPSGETVAAVVMVVAPKYADAIFGTP